MYISTYNQLIDVLTLMKGNIVAYQTEVGATAGDITWINNTLANLVFVRDYCAAYDANKKASFDIKSSFFNGLKGSTVSDFPVQAAAVVPNPPLVGGVLFTFRDMADRFKLGPGYTVEIGIALGIDSDTPLTPTNPTTLKPTIELFAAQSGGVFSIVVGNRADSDMWVVEILRTGAAAWQSAGTFTGKSTDVAITLTNPGQPEQIQVRVQLRKSNANYGLVSDAALVTVNP